ncbi:MAG: pilus assembly protein TadG-related protein [Sinimarinibacterium flocculans]|uniref:pilus assembly protein TadG-related protein n=1 Tax=Sinimarinibacterium flocculans TaxID=985250 RepID=UPI003C65CE1C
MTHPSFRKGPQAQRGATAVFAAAALVAMLTAALLAIDVGRLYVAKRDLQKLANVAALDASRLVSGCAVDDAPFQLPGAGELQEFVEQTVADNGLGSDLLDSAQVEVGTVERRGEDDDGPAGTRFLAVDGADVQAVRVTLRRSFPQPLMPLLPYDESRTMVASATAGQLAVGSFYLGSGLLSLDGGILNALLSGLLGGNVNLTVLDYNGLADVGVSLEALALAVGLEVEDLSDPLALQTQTPLLSDAIDGLAGALSGTASGTITGLLGDLAAVAANGDNLPVPLGQIIGEVDDTAAAAPFVNLLDLLIALGAAANADDSGSVAPIALPVSLSLPGLASVHTFVQILEPPQFSGMQRAGVAEARTAQVKLLVRARVDALNSVTQALNLLLLGGLLGQVTAPPIALGVDVNVAEGRAWLDRIQCPRSSDPTLAADLSASASVATIKLGTFSGAPSAAPAITNGLAQLLGVTIKILGGLIAEVKVNLFLQAPVETTAGNPSPVPLQTVDAFTKVDQASGARPYWLADEAPQTPYNPQTVGTTGLLSGTMSTLFSSMQITASDPDHPNASSSICLLRVIVCTLSIPVGSVLDAVLNPVVALLGTLLNGVGGIVDAIIDPLLQALGIQVGSATVTMNAVSVDQPRIISTEVPAAGS